MENYLVDFKGEIAGLAGACLWAICATVYASIGVKIPPLYLNLAKGVIAIVFIFITFAITRSQFSILSINSSVVIILAISGAIGIGIGDTAYFQALNTLGARKTLLIETITPTVTALLAFIFIGEKLGANLWIGIFITLIGIMWVISERNQVDTNADINLRLQQKSIVTGILWTLISILSEAIGAVVSRYALSTSDISPLESSLIRLLGAVTAIVILILFSSQKSRQKQTKKYQMDWSVKILSIITITAFASTYLGIWLQQTAYKFSPAGVAQTLLATSPLFILPIVALKGEKVSIRSILGAIIALFGVSILVLTS